MTVSSTTRKAGPYNGNGATVSFPFTFKVFSASDVLVVRADATGAETTLALTTDYTVSLNADQNASPGGTVTPVVVLATGLTLTISSALDYLQPVDLTNNGGFYPAVLNTALDRLTIFCQQLAEKVNRAVKVPISSSIDPAVLISQLNANTASAASNATVASAAAVAAAASASAVNIPQSMVGKALNFLRVLPGETGYEFRTATQVRGDIGAAQSGANTDITSLSAPAIGAATATTQAATDSSTKVATTAMVQSVGLHSSGVGAYTASATLSTADIGRCAYYQSASPGTLTLPTTPATGSIISIACISAGACTVARGGSNTIYANGQNGAASITLQFGDSIVLVFDGASWVQVASSCALGVGQTWQNVLGSRAIGTTYTNSTGKPIAVVVSNWTTSVINGIWSAKVGGVLIGYSSEPYTATAVQTINFIVPPGATYVVEQASGTSAAAVWAELR